MRRYYSRNRLVVVLAVVLAGVLMAGGMVVGAQDTTQADSNETNETIDRQNTTYLRIIHASPGAPAVDVQLDNETVASDVAFGNITDYQEVRGGTHNVTITAAGDEETVIFDGVVDLDARSANTLAATGEVDGNESSFLPVLFRDDALQPQGNTAALSVIHLSPDAPTVDVTARLTEPAAPGQDGAPGDAGPPTDAGPGDDSPDDVGAQQDNETNEFDDEQTETPENESEEDVRVLAENVSYRNASDYVTVAAGNYTIEVREASPDNQGEVLRTVNVSLEAGNAYSGIGAGLVGGEAADGDVATPTTTETASTRRRQPRLKLTASARRRRPRPRPADSRTTRPTRRTRPTPSRSS